MADHTVEDVYVSGWTKFNRKGAQSFELQARHTDGDGKVIEATQIKFLEDMPPYEVNQLSTDRPPSLTLSLTGSTKYYKGNKLPDEIKLEGSQRHFVGRDQAGGEKAISSQHFAVDFDSNRNAFVMKGMSRNDGYVRNALQLGIVRAGDFNVGADQTMVDFRAPKSNTEEAWTTDLPLRPGMIVQFAKKLENPGMRVTDLPFYVVKDAAGGPKPRLLLENEGNTAGFPKKIEMRGKDDTKMIGSIAGLDVIINHPQVSSLHAFIHWDDQNKSWTYMSKQKPIVSLGNKFMQEMDRINRDLSPPNPAAARAQMVEIDKLITNMQQVRELMENVQVQEGATIITPYHKRGGAMTEESQRGYQNWVHAYQILYQDEPDKINPQTNKLLDKARAAMLTMANDREDLRDIEHWAVLPDKLPKDTRGILKECRAANYYYNQAMDSGIRPIVDRQLEPLLRKPPEDTFIVSGFKGHHTVTKIEKDPESKKRDRYIVTTYNAGAGAIEAPDNPKNVLAMYKQRLNEDVDVRDFIQLVNERKIRPYFNPQGLQIANAIDESLDKTIIAQTEMPPQGKGNCTTRSTREMLRDMLPDQVFQHLHAHVSNPEVCDPAEVMAALQMRRAALDTYLDHKGEHSVVAPADQQDWGQSVAGMRLSQGSRLELSSRNKPASIF